VPCFLDAKMGCINDNSLNFNCYKIADGVRITDKLFAFDFPTYLYGGTLYTENLSLMFEIYPVEETDFINHGKVNDEVFFDILKCFIESRVVKRKHKPLMFETLKQKFPEKYLLLKVLEN
jgi:hypothetical protein